MKKLPLEGIKIVDLSAALTGPFCIQLPADFGAEVIKIEPPGKGDMLRAFGPPHLQGESPYFLLTNRSPAASPSSRAAYRGDHEGIGLRRQGY